MKNKIVYIMPIVLAASVMLTGCEAIGSIFRAGIWTGIIGVILVVILVIFIIAKLFFRKKD